MRRKNQWSHCTSMIFGTLISTFMGQSVLAATTSISIDTPEQSGKEALAPTAPAASPDTPVATVVPGDSSPESDPAYEATCNALGTDMSRSYAAYQRAGSPSGNFLDYNIQRARRKRNVGLVFLLALTPSAVAGVAVSAVRYQALYEEVREMESAGVSPWNDDLQAVYSKKDAAGIGMIVSSVATGAFLVIGSIFTGKGGGRMRRLKSAESMVASKKPTLRLSGISPLVADASGLSGASLSFTFSSGL